MPNSDQIRDLRKTYGIDSLEKENMHENPFKAFKEWFEKAHSCEEIEEANAMTLATCGKDMQPSARVVLLKGFDDKSLCFYTNYKGRKGIQLTENPKGSLMFFWPPLERQVRIEGNIEKVSPKESDEYFNSRPKGSRLGAIASSQSKKIDSREVLEQRLEDLAEQYKDTDEIPRPDHWGGYIIKPNYFEFWQGRANRLHDRISYELEDDGTWTISRLSP